MFVNGTYESSSPLLPDAVDAAYIPAVTRQHQAQNSFFRTGEDSCRLGARRSILWIPSAKPPWEHRYENWTKKEHHSIKDINLKFARTVYTQRANDV